MIRHNPRPANSPALTLPDAERLLTPAVAVDVVGTLAPLQRGHADPAVQHRPEGIWLVFRQPPADEPVSLLITPPESAFSPGTLRVRAWGAGAKHAVNNAEQLVGVDEASLAGWADFATLLERTAAELPHPVVRAVREHPGLRFPGTGRLLDQLTTVVLEQKVTHDQARAGWRWLLRKYGDRPPGPTPQQMRLPPTAEQLRMIPSWEWHQGWVQPAQAKTLMRLAERGSALSRLSAPTENVAELAQKLMSVPGCGPWTVAETLQRTHGAADLVSVGDYHVAHHVGEALTGHRTDDADMLKLLAPWTGHRQRIVRFIMLAGFRFSRYGARLAPTDFRDR